jgi:hypothetical protein
MSARKQSKRARFYAGRRGVPRAVRRLHMLVDLSKAMGTYRDDLAADYDEDEDGYDCTRCGGQGYCEVDDPFWETGDEYGQVECDACSGTGERAHQTIF